MKYSIGDKVKIISLEKVRSYPKGEDGSFMIAYMPWFPKMDEYAGTIQTITEAGSMCYEIEDCGYLFSPEMIEGPADDSAPETDNYAERLERFVLAVAAGKEMPTLKADYKPFAECMVLLAVELLAAFDEEIKKHRI